jgi:hypothetical protein
MDNLQPARAALPTEDYARTVQRIRQEGQCFICRVVDRTHRYNHHIAATVPTERIYSLSLGSQQANAHVHWHVALPPGVPYDQQEFSALRKDNGVLDLPEADQAELVRTIRGHL